MLSNAHITDVNETNLRQVIESSMQVPVVFFFHSAQSPQCQELGAILEKVAADYAGMMILARVNCDTEQMIASQFGLRAVPTTYLFHQGSRSTVLRGRRMKRLSVISWPNSCRLNLKSKPVRPLN